MHFAVVLLVLLCGCASKPLLDPEVGGYYSSVSSFTSPRSLELKRDKSFDYVQYTREPQEQPDGSITFEAWHYRGQWQFNAPDQVELHPAGEATIVLFVRRSPNYGLVILEPHLVPGILSTWSTDTGSLSFRLLRKRKTTSGDTPKPATSSTSAARVLVPAS